MSWHNQSELRIPEALMTPAPSRLDPDDPDYLTVIRAHRRAVEAGDSLYADPITGLWAMTAQGLWDRGTCCETGCRHCPWAAR